MRKEGGLELGVEPCMLHCELTSRTKCGTGFPQVRGAAAHPRQHPGSHQRQGQRHQRGSGGGGPALL